MKYSLPLLALLAMTACNTSSNKETKNDSFPIRFLTASYQSADEEGVRLFGFDPNTGKNQQLATLTGIAKPTYFNILPDGHHFLTVSETDDGNDALFLSDIIEQGDSLSLQNLSSVPTLSCSPCYVNFHAQTLTAYTANYNGGSLSRYPLNLEEWKLSEPEVTCFESSGPFLPNQSQAHIHCAEFSPDSTTLYLCDLGGDCIHRIDLIENKSREDIQLRPGSGPRHLTFAPNGKFAYVITELSGHVIVLKDSLDTLVPIQYAVSDSVEAHGSADIHITNDGRFLYTSNRLKADGISIFSIDSSTGLIEKIGYQDTGTHPRNFALSPDNRYLLCACRDSDVIQVFARDEKTGRLSPTQYDITLPKPMCVKFLK